MAATEVLKMMTPGYLKRIGGLGVQMERVFRRLEVLSEGMLVSHGQGLLWGCLFKDEGRIAEIKALFQRYCEDVGVLPYFVPVGGFMVTPVVDIDEETIAEIGTRLEEVVLRVVRELRRR